MLRYRWPFYLAICLIALSQSGHAQEPQGAATKAIGAFSNQWDDSSWLPTDSGPRTRYMRPADDQGWKARMIAFQTLVKQGDAAVEQVRDRLRDGSPAQRAIA